MTDRIDEIRAKWDAATDGPWTVCPEHMYIFAPDGMVADDGGLRARHPHPETGQYIDCACRIRGLGARLPQEANMKAIADAPEDVRWLLARVAELEAERDQARHALNANLSTLAGLAADALYRYEHTDKSDYQQGRMDALSEAVEAMGGGK